MGGVEFSAADREWIRQEVNKCKEEEQEHWKTLTEQEQQDYLRREKKVDRFCNIAWVLFVVGMVLACIKTVIGSIIWAFMLFPIIIVLVLITIRVCEEYEYKVWKDYPNKKYRWI